MSDESGTDCESDAGDSGTGTGTEERERGDEPSTAADEPTTSLSALKADLETDGRRSTRRAALEIDDELELDPGERRSLEELVSIVDDRGTDSPGRSIDSSESGDRDTGTELAFDEHFERERVGHVDGEALWERVRREDEGAEGAATDRGHEHEYEYERDRELREVSKRSYCHRCEFFAEPPTAGCTNDGTDILEMPTLETFVVADCPRVRAEEALEDGRPPEPTSESKS